MGSNKSKLQFPNGRQFMVTLPKALIDAKGWGKGDILEFTLDKNGNIILRRKNED